MVPNVRARILPPVDGSITIPELLAFHESHNADIPMYVFCEDGRADITEISYHQFAQGCYKVPQTLDFQRDTSTGKPVVALIAVTDALLYQSTVVGLMHAGYIPFPISPDNTAEAIANLIRKANCHQILATCTSMKSILNETKQEICKFEPGYKLTTGEMPTLSQLFPELYAPGKLRCLAANAQGTKPHLDEIALYLHSSGSTGLPKAIAKTHRELVEFVTFSSAIHLERDGDPPIRIATMHLPVFHSLGVHCHIFLPLLSGITAAIYPPRVVHSDMTPLKPTPDNILDHAQRTTCNVIIAMPSLLQAWSRNAEYVKVLSSLLQVRFSGGAPPLNPKLSQFYMDKGVRLATFYGGTEFGAPCASSMKKDDEKDFQYVEFTERSKVRWIPQGNGLYECQFISCDTHHLSVENLVDVRGYATADLFVPHPKKDYLWKIVGRIDDVIVHSSGEKTVSPPMESIMHSSPHIAGALMFGQAHNQPGVLIEPSPSHRVDVNDVEEVEKFRNLIWPIVDEANSVAPTFSRLYKELLLIADYQKPFIRSWKGTPMRKATLDLYAQEIEALYANIIESKEAAEPVVASIECQNVF